MVEMPHFVHNTDIGQNFLIDRSVVEWMVERAGLSSADYVLEIGPGAGILTEGLLSSQCSAVCTIELDTRLKHAIEMLAIKDKRLTALWGDAVKFDYERSFPWYPNKIIANLPYHITTPLMWVFLEKLVKHGLVYMLLMVQLESAQRIVAKQCGRERSPLGITIQAMGRCEITRDVSQSAFKPQPRVRSCIIEMKIEKNWDLPLNRTWRALLARSFMQRRKTLVNNWTAGYPGMTRELAQDILDRHGLGMSARAEELSLDMWLDLAKEPLFLIEEKGDRRDGEDFDVESE